MRSFADNTGYSWEVRIGLGTIRSVRELFGLNLVDGFDIRSQEPINVVAKIASDPVLLADVLYVVCREQCDEAGLTSEQFGERLVGDPINTAVTALLEALCDFFPSAKARLYLALIQKLNEKLAEDQATDEEMAQAIDHLAEFGVSWSGVNVGGLPAFVAGGATT
jgi:hypothetical protein